MRNIKQNNLIIGSLCALGCEVFYGLSYMFTKNATEKASAFALLGWRFLVAIVVISICIGIGFVKLEMKGKSIKPLLLVALFCPCLYFIGETIGISHTTASESGVFLACIPVASLVASTLILKKKPSKMQITGILITLIGVVITLFAVGVSSSLSVAGYAFLLVAVIAYAIYSVFVEKALNYSGAEITYIMLAVGAVTFVILAMIEAMIHGNIGELIVLPFKDRVFMTAILYQGIGCSILAFFLSNVAIAKIGVNRASSFIGVATVVSVIVGALMLKEPFSVYQIIGTIVIVVGVYIANTSLSTE